MTRKDVNKIQRSKQERYEVCVLKTWLHQQVVVITTFELSIALVVEGVVALGAVAAERKERIAVLEVRHDGLIICSCKGQKFFELSCELPISKKQFLLIYSIKLFTSSPTKYFCAPHNTVKYCLFRCKQCISVNCSVIQCKTV